MKPKRTKRREEIKSLLDRRTRIAAENQLNYLVPTMSPAPKDEETNEIESIKGAISLYKEFGVTDLIIQPKWMGSYCLVYLHREYEKTKIFTRNGYKIHWLDINLFKESLQRAKSLFEDPNVELVVLEGELLPWSALGQGLIDDEYKRYEYLQSKRLEFYKNSTILSKINDIIVNSPEYAKFLENPDSFPSHVKRQYEAISKVPELIPSVDQFERSLNIYSSQLDLFATGSSNLKIELFNLLKIVKNDGTEVLNFDNTIFSKISKAEYLIIKNGDVSSVDSYWTLNQSYNHEGVVVKPLVAGNEKIPYAIKVRNKNYLQMIYGIDFDRRYDYYFKRRNIRPKLRLSIQEYEAALNLLSIPMNTISKENDKFIEMFNNVLAAQRAEEKLDKRL
jgi:hypothetical protein